ncbi:MULTISPECIES: cupin domain-containing protein [Pseudomonas]|uniref:cupin domain-containing protein n=1 Tax=Pseudomonas TaxID=286 RepID=UPI0008A2D942|nr:MULTISPECIES: cupin domain-containing protein [Pseudomonas]MBG7263127.1 cupin domain-containing protein [Pseudomonas aeruginosa]MBH8886857.1 cupin domain-containing protein [Pseudomonas aeruginosa]OFM78534.1 cupin [Pseudomonas sp. HMSC072F09]PHP77152.1 cupin [Pseudomonas aeruginosa]HBO0311846.1 cupin domain-containing protein [Pseudomonas aeruginosa]
MRLNDDIGIRTLVHAGAQDWVSSPTQGVERRLLFRIGKEKARATSIVRYAPGSRFPHHAHPGGEEILVLEGVFQDETGDFPPGSYVRNPPGTGHAPGSEAGCTIFVKLWQFRRDDDARIVQRPGEGEAAALRPGVSTSRLLFGGTGERVMLETWKAGARVTLPNPEGLELLVLAGDVMSGTDRLGRWSWLRLPPGESLAAHVGPEGARVWFKSAPLLHEDVCTFEDEGSTDRVNDDGRR